MAKERTVLNRYLKLVVGYFVYTAARETSINIHDFLNYTNDLEQSLPESSVYYGGPAHG
jgi:hypothetical protein